MSKYTDFVRANIRSASGKTQKEKFRDVARKWNALKNKGGKGLSAPGMRAGKGLKMGRGYKKGGSDLPAGYGAADVRDWSDWGDRPALDGEGIWDTVKDFAKKGLSKSVDLLLEKGGPALAKAVGSKSPAAQKLIELALKHGGPALAKLAKDKIEGFGIHHTRKWLKEHMKGGALKVRRGRKSHVSVSKGGAISGMISKKQQVALSRYIQEGGATQAPGALAALLHGLTVKVE